MTTAPTDERSTRRPTRSMVLLRPVPGTSAVHKLWGGTKLLVVCGISVLLTFYPGWITIGLVAALVLTAARIAHIPRGALPSIPPSVAASSPPELVPASSGSVPPPFGFGPTAPVGGVPA